MTVFAPAIRGFFNLASNTPVNQHGNINRTAKLLKDTSKCLRREISRNRGDIRNFSDSITRSARRIGLEDAFTLLKDFMPPILQYVAPPERPEDPLTRRFSLQLSGWHTPDDNGVDVRRATNVLTSQRATPFAKGNGQHTNLIEDNCYD